jgi:hypothetical protein
MNGRTLVHTIKGTRQMKIGITSLSYIAGRILHENRKNSWSLIRLSKQEEYCTKEVESSSFLDL